MTAVAPTPPATAPVAPIPPLATPGDLAEFLDDPLAVFWRGYREHGHVFSVQLGPQHGVVLLGPPHHRRFFREVDHGLSLGELYNFVVPMFGEVLLAVPDTTARRRQVSRMHEAFEPSRLPGHAVVIDHEVGQWLDALGDDTTFDVWRSMETVAMRIAAAALLGPSVRASIDVVAPLLDDMARGMDFVLPPDLPLEKFQRRDRAREQLWDIVAPLVDERRDGRAGHDDFLQLLVDDPEIGDDTDTLIGMTLCTLFTGYITTAAQMSWAVVHLAHHGDYAASIRAELAASDPPTSERLAWALQETQRLRPVMSHYARRTDVAYEAGGFQVPEGCFTMLCPAVAHRLPEVFTNPDRYDPERFGPSRREGQGDPYALIGFGGGFYRCPGQRFGTLEMERLIGRLLARFTLEPVGLEPGPTTEIGVLRPADCTVRAVAVDAV